MRRFPGGWIGNLVASRSLSRARAALGGFHVAGELGFGLLDGRFGAAPGRGQFRHLAFLQPLVRLLLRLVDFGPRGAYGAAYSAFLAAARSRLSAASLRAPSVASYRWRSTFRIGLKKTPFSRSGAAHEQKCRYRFQQYSAQGLQHGIHDL